VSGVDCVIEEPDKPKKVNSPQPYSHPTHVSRSQSENDMGRASVDSSQSSSSSGTLEKEDEQKPARNGDIAVREKKVVKEKEAIKKQMEQRRRKTSASKERIPEEQLLAVDREGRKHDKLTEKKSTPRRVHSAESSRPKPNEVINNECLLKLNLSLKISDFTKNVLEFQILLI